MPHWAAGVESYAIKMREKIVYYEANGIRYLGVFGSKGLQTLSNTLSCLNTERLV